MWKQLVRVQLLGIALLFIAVNLAHADSRTIRDSIFAAIDARHGFGPYEIEIDASRGIVTLEGTVSSETAREWLEETAARQQGVESVINHLTVKPAGGGSGQNVALARSVRDTLLRTPVYGKYSMDILADDNTVMLRGDVDSEDDKIALEKAARLSPGVGLVVNELTVRQGSTDPELARRVAAALERNVPDLMSGVEVSARNGVVTLRGTKSNHREIDHLLSIALMVDGVRDVKSELVLKSAG